MELFKGEKRYPFICTDTGTQKLIEFDKDGNIVWEFFIGSYSFDMHLLKDNTILYCHYGNGQSGVSIIDRNGNIIFDYNKTEREVFSCQPLENGNILVGELREKRIIEINRQGNIVKEIPVFYDKDDLHEVMRSVRKSKDGNYFAVQPGLCKIIKYSESGKILWEADTLPYTYGIVEKDNGNIVYTCQTALVEIDNNGKEIWKLTVDDVPEMGIKWLLGLSLSDNGNIIVCNWLGHGFEKQGVPLFEISHDKKVVWAFDCREITENMANFQIIN